MVVRKKTLFGEIHLLIKKKKKRKKLQPNMYELSNICCCFLFKLHSFSQRFPLEFSHKQEKLCTHLLFPTKTHCVFLRPMLLYTI